MNCKMKWLWFALKGSGLQTDCNCSSSVLHSVLTVPIEPNEKFLFYVEKNVHDLATVISFLSI